MVGTDRTSSASAPTAQHASSMLWSDVAYLYESKILFARAVEDRAEGRREVVRIVRNILATVEPRQRLPVSVFDILDDTVRSEGRKDVEDGTLVITWSPSKASECLRALETYALNLLDFPWKKEFYTISTFSGFYQTRIKLNLLSPSRLFALIGYQRVDLYHRLTGSQPPSREDLLNAAIDFLVASVECDTQAVILDNVRQYSVTASDVFHSRRAFAGTPAESIDKLKHSASSSFHVAVASTGIVRHDDSHQSTVIPELHDNRRNFGKDADSDVPDWPVDEERLELVTDGDSSPPPLPSIPASLVTSPDNISDIVVMTSSTVPISQSYDTVLPRSGAPPPPQREQSCKSPDMPPSRQEASEYVPYGFPGGNSRGSSDLSPVSSLGNTARVSNQPLVRQVITSPSKVPPVPPARTARLSSEASTAVSQEVKTSSLSTFKREVLLDDRSAAGKVGDVNITVLTKLSPIGTQSMLPRVGTGLHTEPLQTLRHSEGHEAVAISLMGHTEPITDGSRSMQHHWQCSHCTFANEPGTDICAICQQRGKL